MYLVTVSLPGNALLQKSVEFVKCSHFIIKSAVRSFPFVVFTVCSFLNLLQTRDSIFVIVVSIVKHKKVPVG